MTQPRRPRKSRPSFTAWKTRHGIQHRTTWPNWPLSQRLADCIHLSPSNGHSARVSWCSSLVSHLELDFFPCMIAIFLGKVLMCESRFHHLRRCTKLGRPHIRKSHSGLFNGGSLYRRPRHSWLRRLEAESTALHLLHLYHVHGGFYSRPCSRGYFHRKQLDLEVLFLDQSS